MRREMCCPYGEHEHIVFMALESALGQTGVKIRYPHRHEGALSAAIGKSFNDEH